MSSEFGAFIQRYAWLFGSIGPALYLLVGRARAGALVAAGRVTDEELSGFVRAGFLVVVVGFLLLLMDMATVPAEQALCKALFPPRGAAGWIYWTLLASTSFGLLYWIWLRGGDNLLARLAPAFTWGPVLERSFSPVLVRYFITALVVVPIGGNVLMDMIGGGFPMPECAAG